MEGTRVSILDVREVGRRTFELEIEAPPDFEANPGHFVQVRVPRGESAPVRHYSICSPTVDRSFRITVEHKPDGRVTPELIERRAGAVIEIDGPFGRVHFDGEDRVVSIGAGPGIGPALAVAERTTIEGGEAAVLVHHDHPLYEHRLSHLSTRTGPVAMVRDDVRSAISSFGALVPGIEHRTVFVYGFSPFVSTVTSAFSQLDREPAGLKVENFN